MKAAKKEFAYLRLALADSFSQTGHFQQALGLLKKAKRILRDEDKIKQSLALSRMAMIYNARGEYQRALRLNEGEYRLAQRHATDVNDAEAMHTLALSSMNLGMSYIRQSQSDPALPLLKQAIDLLDQLLAIFPGNAQYATHLSEAYGFLAKYYEQLDGAPDSLSFYERSSATAKALADRFPDSLWLRERLVVANERLATAWLITGNLNDALELYVDCQMAVDDLLDYFPDKFSLRMLSANLRLQVAKWNKYRENDEMSITNLERAKKEFAALAELFPHDFSVKEKLALCDQFLGEMLEKTGRPESAFRYYREFYTAAMQLYALCPDNRTIRQHLATAHERLTKAYQDRNDLQNAMLHCAQAWHISQQLYEKDPSNQELMLDFAVMNRYAGEILWMEGEYERAEPFMQEMERLFKMLSDAGPENEIYNNNMVYAMQKRFAFNEEKKKSGSVYPKFEAFLDRVLHAFFAVFGK